MSITDIAGTSSWLPLQGEGGWSKVVRKNSKNEIYILKICRKCFKYHKRDSTFDKCRWLDYVAIFKVKNPCIPSVITHVYGLFNSKNQISNQI
jgi:hypothetical protein